MSFSLLSFRKPAFPFGTSPAASPPSSPTCCFFPSLPSHSCPPGPPSPPPALRRLDSLRPASHITVLSPGAVHTDTAPLLALPLSFFSPKRARHHSPASKVSVKGGRGPPFSSADKVRKGFGSSFYFVPGGDPKETPNSPLFPEDKPSVPPFSRAFPPPPSLTQPDKTRPSRPPFFLFFSPPFLFQVREVDGPSAVLFLFPSP